MIRNYFNIGNDESSQRTEPVILDAGKYLKQNRAFSKYMVMGNAERLIVRPCVVQAVNRDRKQGPFSATLSVRLAENELDGLQIDRIGLSPFADGSGAVGVAKIPGILKEEGSALILTATLYLDTQMQRVEFIGENNPLADYFLGLQPLEEGAFTARPAMLGPDEDGVADGQIFGASTPLQCRATENGFRLNGVFHNQRLSCVRIEIHGHPVLLARRLAGSPQYERGTTMLDANGAGRLDKEWIDEILDTEAADGSTAACTLARSGQSARYTDTAQWTAGPGSELLSEPAGDYFAVRNERDTLVCRMEQGQPEVIRWHKRSGKAAMLCRNGGVVSFGDSIIVEDAYGSTQYPIAVYGPAAAVSEGADSYHVCICGKDSFARYLLKRGTMRLLELKRAQTEIVRIFRSGDGIAILDGETIGVYTSDGTIAAHEDGLARLLSEADSGFRLIEASDGQCLYTDGTGRFFARYDSVCRQRAEAETVLTNQFFLSAKEGQTELAMMDRLEGKYHVLGQMKRNISHCARAGKYVLCLTAEGALHLYNLQGGNAYLYGPDVAGKTVTYTSVSRVMPVSEGEDVEMELDIDCMSGAAD